MKKFMKFFSNKKVGVALVIVFIFINVYITTSMFTSNPKKLEYVKFEEMLSHGQVQEVILNFSAPKFTFTDIQGNKYITDNPRMEGFKALLLKSNVEVTENNSNRLILDFAVAFLPFPIFLGFFYFLFKNSLKGVSVVSNQKPKRTVKSSIRFCDIAGNEESKEDMIYLVDFLKEPKKYRDMGAILPKGVIFYGPPGTGKTLMAKAIAGEAGVPFHYASGSDFVEMYVGVGAKRVRELFAEAKKNTPCVVFVDEIDAIGGKRGRDSNSERDQTINALLNELDGFDTSQGILVIAATNRLDDLDEALVRPGRFDRHIAINLPDKEDRLKILHLHAKGKTFSKDVDFEQLAKLTIGFAGAGLKTLLNESAIIAVQNKHSEITANDVDKAFYKIVMKGDEKKNRKNRDKSEIELVAWHEAGHAVIAKLVAKKSVPKVTIIPSTSGAGGVTFIPPEKLGLHSKEDLINDVMISYGGRVGEYLLLGHEDKITTGASSDISKATATIKSIIKYYGMTDSFGMLNLDDFGYNDDKAILGEAKRMAKDIYDKTLEILKNNKDILKSVADKLIEKETLEEKELDQILFGKSSKNEKTIENK
ncbi:ATP-dependent metallopeptidase FtsH/Yme1/Tma family protein [Alkaliphilus sp. B6464]|uniref:ATP-dependent metallopeptidase FtsH/Yme1/Tma family protein n=1 Tax=Alkaliphilus sp. B6464 TaxID=2731219 RepID=UPI001BA6F0B3|nr:AAA family ATPase [Alkaliphilus sp. B6464]QUH22119.1 ATP-dependent zinc metalloprotease FtsH [Alkaliphilus sp. B6464]